MTDAERRVQDITTALITFALALGPPSPARTPSRIPTQPGAPAIEHVQLRWVGVSTGGRGTPTHPTPTPPTPPPVG